MYKFIKYHKKHLLQLVGENFIFISDRTKKNYLVCKKDGSIFRELEEMGINPEPNIISSYFFLTDYSKGITNIYSLQDYHLLGHIDRELDVRSYSWNTKENLILFFENRERSYYQITPETWEVEKIPYPDSSQYYYTSFGKYIVFKNKEEQWFVYESNLNNLVWSGDYAWASTFEHKGKTHRYWNFGAYPYGEDRMILVYSPCHAFCINLITKEVEWQNKITGKYMVVGDIAYNHLGGERIATCRVPQKEDQELSKEKKLKLEV